MNKLQRAEYIALRLVRRFVFSERTANRFARWLPYYAPNQNELHPEEIVSRYTRFLRTEGLTLHGQNVLEVGAGRTNLVGYGLIAAGATSATLLEPYVAFDTKRDKELQGSHTQFAAVNSTLVSRVQNFAEVEPRSVDILLSNSVLEHVRDLASFFKGCKRVLAANGVMLHLVDYRDHFFKYPYGFLTFSADTWRRWLDPGDLPRWRLPDHAHAMRTAGFEVTELERTVQPLEFQKVHELLDSQFLAMGEDAQVTFAVIMAALPPTQQIQAELPTTRVSPQ